MRTIIAASLIFLFWFMLSGHTEVLLIALGVLSTLLVVFLSSRMKIIDHESYPIHLSLKLLTYFVYLGKEILQANLDVIKRIIKPGRSVNPAIKQLPVSKETDLGKVIYANSITLTPGTVTVEMTDEKLKIHALNKDAIADLEKGVMADKVPDKEDITS